MAEASSQFDLESVLEQLSFKQFYPEKLSREELYQITPESLSAEQREKSPAAWQFIYDLTRYNYHARNIKTSETENVEPYKMSLRQRMRRKREAACAQVHPLDVLVAVFLCCDPTAKQDLIMHLWGCKLAMPFAIQVSNKVKPSVYLWPFRSLIGQFQKSESYAEMQMIHKPMKCIAFLRAGENEQYSKSYLLNCLIGGSEKPHPMFFHRNSEGSKQLRSSATNGLIEIGWYLPSETKSGRFREPRLFVNHRGDSLGFNNQTELIGKIATITIVLCTTENLKGTKVLANKLLKYGSRVILLISDQKPNLEEIENHIESSFGHVPESQFDVVTAERFMLSEILENVHHIINKMELNSTKEVVLSDFVKNLSSMRFILDETDYNFKSAFEYSKDILAAIKNVVEENRKQQLLPLQEDYWKKWSQMDRDFWRFDQLDESEKKKYGNKKALEANMRKLRKRQFDHFSKKGLSIPMRVFIKALSESNNLTRKIFLRMLKLELDSLSRTHLRPFYDRYQELVNQTLTATEDERIKINSKLTELDEMKSRLSFGMEHMIRELGQLYEACESQPEMDIMIPIGGNSVSYKTLPHYACLSLMEGYPVEILDGEACSVPLMWVRAVFSQLPNVLKATEINSKPADEIRVHAISVLGIQSSGKSTFLNVIFGLQFAVSAGRCTRGAFMQLVKVQPSMKNELQADFILAIDTEGLKAAELISSESVKHDNELSTFVIGLADTTVINLMGENATYLQENLPIAVHAFLRMNLVGLHPRCTIVHHNVDKRNKEKLLQQSRILESVLNKLTTKACELEKIPPRLFQEIIEFSIANHTDYIPGLYEGEQPMAAINIGYSKESDSVRTKLINFVRSEAEVATVSYFAHHLENLWNAIRKDRFVYEFRTTLETEARLDLDKGYCRILQEFLKQVDDIVAGLIPSLKSKQKTCKQVEEKFAKAVAVVEKKSKSDLEQFIDRPKRITSSCYDQWKQKCLQNLQTEMEKSRKSAFEQFRNLNAKLHPTIHMDNFELFFTFVSRLKRIYDDFDYCFSRAWLQWVEALNLSQHETAVLTDTTVALQEICSAHQHLLEERIVKTSSIYRFQPMKTKHLNHGFHTFSESRINELLKKMQYIKRLIQNEYSIELATLMRINMPYTYRIPKQILLKLKESLREKLDNFDPSNEISHQYSIDLLLCTSGTMVKDLYTVVQNQSCLGPLKEDMKCLTQKKVHEAQESADRMLEIVFNIINKMIESEFPLVLEKCLYDCLQMSDWRSILQSKQALLGFCLYHIIRADDEELLILYFHSPEKAVFRYLTVILRTIIRHEHVQQAIKSYVTTSAEKVCNPVYTSGRNDIPFEGLFDCICKRAALPFSVTDFVRFHSREYMKSVVNPQMVKDKLGERLDAFITTTTEKLINEVFIDSTKVISVCASRVIRQIIGCKELCPFCKEICKFSGYHPGQHECFVHRPVGCKGMHWKGTSVLSYETCTMHCEKGSYFNNKGSFICFKDLNTVHKTWKIKAVPNEEPSCVWKWIFVNKNEILRNYGSYELPNDMPEDWRSIHRKQVLRNIQQQFDI